MHIGELKMVACTVVEEHDPENKPDTVHCADKSIL